MKPYLQKLQEEAYCHRYLVLGVRLAIGWAIYDKEIRKNKVVLKRLKELYAEICKLKLVYRRNEDVDDYTFISTLDIKEETYELLRYL
jgi:hypothetical protein